MLSPQTARNRAALLIRLCEEVNPGHGIVQIVEPVAEKIEMRAAL